jgi:cobalt/nickel transport system permease protein
MGSGHSHKLHVHGHSVVHRMPAQIKLVTLVLFLLVVIATPRTAFWAFGVYAMLLAIVIAVAGLPPKFVLKRMVVEIPFVVFALILPSSASASPNKACWARGTSWSRERSA